MSFQDSKQAANYLGANGVYRHPADFYPTPRVGITNLLDYMKFGNLVWEPAAGDGAISSVVREYGYKTYESDLNDWGAIPNLRVGDFLDHEYKAVDAVITNPPYHKGLSEAFIMKALDMTKELQGKVAILQKISFLETPKRAELFRNTPFECVLPFAKRIPRMHSDGWEGKKATSMICFAWYIWSWKYEGKPYVDWLPGV